MDPCNQYHSQSPPKNGGNHRNISLEVPDRKRVIPKPDMKQPIQHDASPIFQDRCSDHANKKDRSRMMPHRICHHQDQQRTESIDWDKRAMQKAPIHPLLGQDRNISRLPYPSCKRIEEKIQGSLCPFNLDHMKTAISSLYRGTVLSMADIQDFCGCTANLSLFLMKFTFSVMHRLSSYVSDHLLIYPHSVACPTGSSQET